jgi:hypothetical protein
MIDTGAQRTRGHRLHPYSVWQSQARPLKGARKKSSRQREIQNSFFQRGMGKYDFLINFLHCPVICFLPLSLVMRSNKLLLDLEFIQPQNELL